MKKRIFTLTLALVMCLSLFPMTTLANESSITVTATDIRADSVSNSEGYGSLVIQGTVESPPQYALIDTTGNFVFGYGVFPCRIFTYEGIFVNGIVTGNSYGYTEGVYSLFDLSGKQIIPEQYDFLSFYNGYALATNRKDETESVDRFLIDTTGKVIMTLPEIFNVVENAGGGDYMFEQQIWGYGYYGDVGGYSDGLLWFYTGADIENNISEVTGLTADDIPSDKRNKLWLGGPYGGYMDLSGNVVISQQYNTVYPFTEGLACVEGDLETINTDPYGRPGESVVGKFGYIDSTGSVVIDFKYSKGSSFSGGLAYVADDNGKYGYINKAGEIVVPLQYDMAFGAGDGQFCSVGNIVETSTNEWGYTTNVYKYGFTDAAGNIVVPLEYDDVSVFQNGVAYAIKDGIVYILTLREDVPSQWATAEIEAAIAAGLVPAKLQQNYTQPVSRGDVAEMFIKLLEQSSGQSIEDFLAAKGVSINQNAFTDTNDYAVLAANALGIINGVGDGKFDANGTFTRAQIAAIINRVANVLGVEVTGFTHSFTDVSGHWVDDELGWPAHAGIISGMGDNRFEPDGELTTEQAIAITYRALQYFNA